MKEREEMGRVWLQKSRLEVTVDVETEIKNWKMKWGCVIAAVYHFHIKIKNFLREDEGMMEECHEYKKQFSAALL